MGGGAKASTTDAAPAATGPERPLRPSPGWAMGAAIVGALLVAAVVAVGALVAVPPSMANLASSTADGVASEPLDADADAGGAVVVPAGWIVVRESEEEILVRTPDAALEARVRAASVPAEEALAAAVPGIADEIGAAPGAERRETLAAGTFAVHVDVGPSVTVAAIAESAEARESVVIEARIRDDVDPARYRAALAQLLDGVSP
ncbi:hypothetical protein [Microbacterium aurantiacum]|uniref:hypothetical protein n=1 Tax=Microbacterium aurantiacum TaxID=162393 RepID=UPI003F495D23